jgi:hypothetical protein
VPQTLLLRHGHGINAVLIAARALLFVIAY